MYKHFKLGYLIDKNIPITIEVELKNNTQNQLCLSISGNIWASDFHENKETQLVETGQIQDSIKTAFKTNNLALAINFQDYVTLMVIWDLYHLNDMHAGTPAQEEALHNYFTIKNIEYDYEKAISYLKEINLYLDPNQNNYCYGSQWLYQPLPQWVIDFIHKLPGNKEKYLINHRG